MKATISRTFDCESIASLKQSERFKARLENEGYSVTTSRAGLFAVRITGVRK